jgi:hypothetical protein
MRRVSRERLVLVGAPAGYSLTTLPAGHRGRRGARRREDDQRGGHALGEPGDGDMPLGDAWTSIPDLIDIGVLAREDAHSAS